MLVINIIHLTIGKTVDLDWFRYLDFNFVMWLDLFIFYFTRIQSTEKASRQSNGVNSNSARVLTGTDKNYQ